MAALLTCVSRLRGKARKTVVAERQEDATGMGAKLHGFLVGYEACCVSTVLFLLLKLVLLLLPV